MKKLLSLLVVFTFVVGFASDAHAGLNFFISLDSPFRVHRSHYTEPQVRYYDEAPRFYRPRRRVVYYETPVYYSAPRYSYRERGCR